MLWIKALHIIFVVCWFAGIFYLPRIYVNCAEVTSEETKQHLLGMARRLYLFMSPLAILAIVFGIWLLFFNLDYYLQAFWMQVKLGLVSLLAVYHLWCGHLLKNLRNGEGRSSKFYRIINELPVLVLFAVVFWRY